MKITLGVLLCVLVGSVVLSVGAGGGFKPFPSTSVQASLSESSSVVSAKYVSQLVAFNTTGEYNEWVLSKADAIHDGGIVLREHFAADAGTRNSKEFLIYVRYDQRLAPEEE